MSFLAQQKFRRSIFKNAKLIFIVISAIALGSATAATTEGSRLADSGISPRLMQAHKFADSSLVVNWKSVSSRDREKILFANLRETPSPIEEISPRVVMGIQPNESSGLAMETPDSTFDLDSTYPEQTIESLHPDTLAIGALMVDNLGCLVFLNASDSSLGAVEFVNGGREHLEATGISLPVSPGQSTGNLPLRGWFEKGHVAQEGCSSRYEWTLYLHAGN